MLTKQGNFDKCIISVSLYDAVNEYYEKKHVYVFLLWVGLSIIFAVCEYQWTEKQLSCTKTKQ